MLRAIAACLAIASSAILFACEKHEGDACLLEKRDRACAKGLYCENPSAGLLGLSNERGICRAYVAEQGSCSPEHPAARPRLCAEGLRCETDGICRRPAIQK